MTYIKSCLLTALLALSFGIGAANADPLLPRVPVGSTAVFVPTHYAYHHGHRVLVPAHYTVYTSGCKWSQGYYYKDCGYTRYYYKVY